MDKNDFIGIMVAVILFVAIIWFARQYYNGEKQQENYTDKIIDNIATIAAKNDIVNKIKVPVASHSLNVPAEDDNPVPYDEFNDDQMAGALGDDFDGMNVTGQLGELVRNGKVLTQEDLLPNDPELNEHNQFKVPTTYIDSNLTANGVDKFGVDTVGSSKRNATQDIRGNIPCPKMIVSPWYNSTIDPDYNLKGFGCA